MDGSAGKSTEGQTPPFISTPGGWVGLPENQFSGRQTRLESSTVVINAESAARHSKTICTF